MSPEFRRILEHALRDNVWWSKPKQWAKVEDEAWEYGIMLQEQNPIHEPRSWFLVLHGWVFGTIEPDLEQEREHFRAVLEGKVEPRRREQ